MIPAEIEPAERTSRRRTPRAPVSLDTALGRGGIDRALCKVVDISLGGARLSTYSALRGGQAVWLMLPGIGHVAADVMWADDFTAGCQFHKPLQQRQLDDLLALAT